LEVGLGIVEGVYELSLGVVLDLDGGFYEEELLEVDG